MLGDRLRGQRSSPRPGLSTGSTGCRGNRSRRDGMRPRRRAGSTSSRRRPLSTLSGTSGSPSIVASSVAEAGRSCRPVGRAARGSGPRRPQVARRLGGGFRRSTRAQKPVAVAALDRQRTGPPRRTTWMSSVDRSVRGAFERLAEAAGQLGVVGLPDALAGADLAQVESRRPNRSSAGPG